MVGDPAQGTLHPDRQKRLLQQRDTEVYQIEVDTMDNQIASSNLPKPDFVKIDVEGVEMEVLQGMSQVIRDYKPAMLIEMHSTNNRGVIEFLLSHDYRICQVESGIDITQDNIDMAHKHLYVY